MTFNISHLNLVALNLCRGYFCREKKKRRKTCRQAVATGRTKQKPERVVKRGLWLRICGKYFLSFPLARETQAKKNRAILQNFNSGMLKLTKTPILPNCQVSDNFFLNLIIQELKFCEIAQLYICLRNTGCCLYYYSVNHQYTHI